MTKKILVWGIGWLGLPLIKRLKDLDHNVCSITRSTNKKELLTSTFLNALTIDELHKYSNYLSDFDFFILTIPPVVDSMFIDKLSSILNLLPHHCQVIYTSSTGIYKNREGLLNETSEVDVKSNAYQMEDFLQKQRTDNLTILRLGGLIGPKRHPVHYLAKKVVNANPNHAVNLIQQIDVINVIQHFIEAKKSGVFNICSPEHPSRKQYYDFATSKFGLCSLTFENDDLQSGKIVDTTKVRELFPNFVFTSIYDFEKCK